MNRRNFLALPVGFVGFGDKKKEPDLRCDFWVKGVHYALGVNLSAELDSDKHKRSIVKLLFDSGERTAIGEMVKQGTLKRELTDIVV